MNKAEQVHKHIEHDRHEGQTRLNVYGQSLPNSFQVAGDCDQRQNGFDTHAFVPSSFLANLHVFWNAVLVSKTVIRQNDGFADKGIYRRVEALIVHIHGVPFPGDHPTKVVQQPAKLDSNTPATFVAAIFAHLLWTAALTNGENQFDQIAVNDREVESCRL